MREWGLCWEICSGWPGRQVGRLAMESSTRSQPHSLALYLCGERGDQLTLQGVVSMKEAGVWESWTHGKHWRNVFHFLLVIFVVRTMVTMAKFYWALSMCQAPILWSAYIIFPFCRWRNWGSGRRSNNAAGKWQVGLDLSYVTPNTWAQLRPSS